MAEEDRDLSGHTLGDFVLRERIGSGGWGLVYRAEQPALKREVAVKVLRHRGDAVHLERFKCEAQLASRLNHPYAAQIYAYGVVESGADIGLRWIAMELVQGMTLSEWLKTHGPMSLGQFVQFFECVVEVVHLAHERGIVHRDLKPSNIMVIELGGRLLPKLLDFGIAKVNHEVTFAEDHWPGDRVPTAQLRPAPRGGVCQTESDPLAHAAKHELTRSGVALGSGPYTAPEQWGNASAVDRAADVYSLGIIIYEALTGRRPYIADSADGYRRLHCEAPVPGLGGGVDFSPALDRVLRAALAKDPGDRHTNVLELAAALRAVLRASDREQLRSSAQQWEDRECAPDLLWSAELLAELAGVTRRALAGELSPLECSFVAASYRRARRGRWVRRSLVVLAATMAALGVCGFLLYRAAMQTRMLQDRAVLQTRMADQIATEAEVEQGRQALLHGESNEAVRHLEQAYQRGDHSPGVSFMLARALQPRMSELARFHSSAGRMWSAAFAPDGKRVLTTDDKSAQMWDASSSQLLFTMSHGDTVYRAVFSPDGSRIVTAGGDGTVRIWSAATGAPVRVLTSQRSDAKQWRYSAVAVSSRFVAAVDIMGRVAHVWDAETGAQIAELDGDAAEKATLAFSPDEHWLVTTGRDEVRVFDTSAWRHVSTIAAPRVRCLSFAPTSARLAVGTYDGVASIWELPRRVRVLSLRDAGAAVDAIAFSRDGLLLATASRDGTEQVWDAASGGLRTQFNSHHDKINAIEFSLTGDLLLSAGADGAVVVSNVATGMPVSRLEGPQGLVFTAHFDAESRRVVGASFDGTARVWDAASPYRRWDSPQIGAECDTEESLVPDHRFIALSCPGHGTHVWDTSRGELLAELPGVTPVEGNYASALPALTATGDRAAIARGNTVEVYALPSAQLLRTIVHPAAVNAVAFAPAGHDLVSGALDGSLLITHDDRDPVVLPTSAAGIDAAAILADGRVVAADAGGRLRVIGPDGKALRTDLVASSRTRLLRPSPDGRRLVTISTTSEQAPPMLWDLDQYRLVARLEGHVGRVFTARFVAGDGGHEILTAGADGTARLWDAATGRAGQSFRGDSHFLVDAALAPGGAVIVAGGSDGFLRFWDTSNARLLWMMQAHRSYVVGVHYEGDEIVTRGFAGDVVRWVMPLPARIIESCHATGCAVVASAGR